MTSLILRVASKILLVLTLLFSIWALFRGHNAPGGGFIGGLLAASGFALYLFAHGSNALRRVIRINLSLMLAFGLLAGLMSGVIGMMDGRPFLSGVWTNFNILGIKIGSPILFDIGVYLVILASVLTIMLALEESV